MANPLTVFDNNHPTQYLDLPPQVHYEEPWIFVVVLSMSIVRVLLKRRKMRRK
ncbi:hypothetical protein PM082_016531 [Marasmius tenuissimus]|nr:hypothetical protein PM082_016531 [Marasmius tenuissimus]